MSNESLSADREGRSNNKCQEEHFLVLESGLEGARRWLNDCLNDDLCFAITVGNIIKLL